EITKQILRKGWQVRALVREPAFLTSVEGLEVVRWEATDNADPKLLEGVDVVCHLAAYIPSDMADLSVRTAEHCLDVNTVGTLRLLQACTNARVRRVVNFSSGNAYAPGQDRPTEDCLLYPSLRGTAYLVSKIAQEMLADHWRICEQLEICTLRPSSVYGPGQVKGMLPRFIGQLRNHESVTLRNNGAYGADFVHVADVALATVEAIHRGCQGAFNVGSGSRTTISEMLAVLSEIIDVDRTQVTIEPFASSSD